MADQAPTNDGRALRALRQNLWPTGAWGLKARLIAVFGMTLVSSSFAAAGPLFMRKLVDSLTTAPLVTVPLLLTIGYPLTRLAGLALIQARVILAATVMEAAKASYAATALARLLGLGRSFRLDRGSGALARTLERGVLGLEWSIRSSHVVLFQVLLEAILSSAVVWRVVGGRFGLILLGVMAGYAAIAILFTTRQVRLRRRINERDTASARLLVDTLLNYDLVESFASAPHEVGRYGAARAEQGRFAVRGQAAISLMNIAWQALEASALAIVLTLAAAAVVRGRMTVGELVMIQVYMMQVFANMTGLGFVYSDARQGFVDLGELQAVIDRQPEVVDAPHAPHLVFSSGHVQFVAVTFGYDPGRPIIQDLSFEVPAGRTVALVGATGAGKTTLGHLLLRFHDVQSGAIRIDGQDIRAVSRASLREAIGVVAQDTQLFDQSILYNIRYGRLNASEGDAVEAARRAALDGFVSTLPDRYETRIGERGLKLSGGERQRIAIARLILKAPPILLFDEATSSLDTLTERAIQSSLGEIAKGRTSLVIAHRLSTIVDADEIIVLDQGRAVERGDHAALLHHDGVYAAMWNRQAER